MLQVRVLSGAPKGYMSFKVLETTLFNDIPDLRLAESIFEEVYDATRNHGNFKSAHEAYAVLLEEVDEFWDEVKKKRKHRNKGYLKHELIQVAAMAIKAIKSIDVMVD
jgi:NTP pyrophosphatase (non-canonical NTP hydrolase)